MIDPSKSPHTDPVARLERLADRHTPHVDPAFANRLETDLRLAMAETAVRTARPWWQPATALVAVLALVVGGWLALRSSPTTEVVMTAADGAAVEFPDGERIDGVAGLELPDGTRIVIGPDGSAIVGGVVLGAGVEATVVDGYVEITDDGQDDLEDNASIPSSTVPTTNADPVETSASDGVAPTTSTPATSTTQATTSTSRAAERPSSTSRPSERPSTTETIPTTSTTRSPGDETVVELTVEAGRPRQLVLTWIVNGDNGTVVSWDVEVLRGDRRRIVLTITDSASRSAVVERLESEVSYRVIGRDATGEPIVTSAAVPAPPP